MSIGKGGRCKNNYYRGWTFRVARMKCRGTCTGVPVNGGHQQTGVISAEKSDSPISCPCLTLELQAEGISFYNLHICR